MVLQRSVTDVGALVLDLVDQFQIPAESAQVRLTSNNLPSDCLADVDRVQIERMLSNLLSNALKFTSAGGEVHVGLRDLSDAFDLRISDTGRGIAPEHLPHIFDRFYRIGETGASPSPEKGLGLGLSFVAWIAKAHGGIVNVTSKLGEGTTFDIRIPKGVVPAIITQSPMSAQLKQT